MDREEMLDHIPENERWLHDPAIQEDLDRALKWMAEHPPQETDLAEFEARLFGDEPPQEP
jgi:hypothetical protein